MTAGAAVSMFACMLAAGNAVRGASVVQLAMFVQECGLLCADVSWAGYRPACMQQAAALEDYLIILQGPLCKAPPPLAWLHGSVTGTAKGSGHQDICSPSCAGSIPSTESSAT